MRGQRQSPGQVWLVRQAKAKRSGHMLVVALGMGGIACAVVQAWCLAMLLAPALGTPSNHTALWAGGFAVFALGRAGLGYRADRLGFETGAASRRRLRSALFVGLFSRSPSATSEPPGALSALAIDQIEALDGYFARWRPIATLAMAGPVLVLAAVLSVDFKAALLLVVAGLAVPFGMALAGIGAAAAARSQFVAMSRLQARFLDRVRGIATIVLAGQAQAEAERLRAAADELTRRTMRVLRTAFLSSAILDAAAAASLVLLALRFGLALRAGTVTDPAVAIFPILLVVEFFLPLRNFAAAYQDRLQAHEAAERLAAIEPPPAIPSAPLPVRTVNATGLTLVFDNVCLTRDEARGPVLDRLSFRVSPGETAVLVGPSGAGKTTVIELALGFLQPDRGRITLNGADLATITAPALTRMTAWIGQRPVLFAGSLRDNIRFGREDATDADIESAAESAGLAPFAASLPHGLDTMIGEDGYGLSGGQAQRVAIARAFVRDAKLLLLDEPTAHLDPVTEADVLESLRRLTAGRTVLLASHSNAAAAFAGRRIELEVPAQPARGAA